MVSECRRDELLLNKQFKEWFIRSSRESFSILGGVDPPAVFALRKWVHSLLLVPWILAPVEKGHEIYQENLIRPVLVSCLLPGGCVRLCGGLSCIWWLRPEYPPTSLRLCCSWRAESFSEDWGCCGWLGVYQSPLEAENPVMKTGIVWLDIAMSALPEYWLHEKLYLLLIL